MTGGMRGGRPVHREYVLPKGFNVAGSLSNLTVFRGFQVVKCSSTVRGNRFNGGVTHVERTANRILNRMHPMSPARW